MYILPRWLYFHPECALELLGSCVTPVTQDAAVDGPLVSDTPVGLIGTEHRRIAAGLADPISRSTASRVASKSDIKMRYCRGGSRHDSGAAQECGTRL